MNLTKKSDTEAGVDAEDDQMKKEDKLKEYGRTRETQGKNVLEPGTISGTQRRARRRKSVETMDSMEDGLGAPRGGLHEPMHSPTRKPSKDDTTTPGPMMGNVSELTRRLHRFTISGAAELEALLAKQQSPAKRLSSTHLLRCYREVRLAFSRQRKTDFADAEALATLRREICMLKSLHRLDDVVTPSWAASQGPYGAASPRFERQATSTSDRASPIARIKATVMMRLGRYEKRCDMLLAAHEHREGTLMRTHAELSTACAHLERCIEQGGPMPDSAALEAQLMTWRSAIETTPWQEDWSAKTLALMRRVTRLGSLVRQPGRLVDVLVARAQGKLRFAKRFCSYFHNANYQSLKKLRQLLRGIQQLVKRLRGVSNASLGLTDASRVPSKTTGHADPNAKVSVSPAGPGDAIGKTTTGGLAAVQGRTTPEVTMQLTQKGSLTHEQAILLASLAEEAEEYYETLALHKQVLKQCLSPSFSPIYRALLALRRDLEDLVAHRNVRVPGITGIDPADLLLLQRRLYALDPSCAFKKEGSSSLTTSQVAGGSRTLAVPGRLSPALPTERTLLPSGASNVLLASSSTAAEPTFFALVPTVTQSSIGGGSSSQPLLSSPDAGALKTGTIAGAGAGIGIGLGVGAAWNTESVRLGKPSDKAGADALPLQLQGVNMTDDASGSVSFGTGQLRPSQMASSSQPQQHSPQSTATDERGLTVDQPSVMATDLPAILPSIPGVVPRLGFSYEHNVRRGTAAFHGDRGREAGGRLGGGRSMTEKADPLVQSVLYELLYECYERLYALSSRLEPIDARLVPIHTKLLGLKRMLAELWKVHLSPAQLIRVDKAVSLKAGMKQSKKAKRRLVHVTDMKLQLEQALIPLKMQLNAIDGQRVDGKFVDPLSGAIPKGQAALHSLLGECFDLLDHLSDYVVHEESGPDEEDQDEDWDRGEGDEDQIGGAHIGAGLYGHPGFLLDRPSSLLVHKPPAHHAVPLQASRQQQQQQQQQHIQGEGHSRTAASLMHPSNCVTTSICTAKAVPITVATTSADDLDLRVLQMPSDIDCGADYGLPIVPLVKKSSESEVEAQPQ